MLFWSVTWSIHSIPMTTVFILNRRLNLQVQLSAAERAASIVEGTPGAKLYANEPYYQPATRYQGLPKYMQEELHPWWPKVDCTELMAAANGGESMDCYPSWMVEKMKSDPKVGGLCATWVIAV